MRMLCKNCFREYDGELGMCPHCGYEENDPAEEPFCLAPGTVVRDRYAVGQVIGIGGFGIIYRAWSIAQRRVLAVKEYYPGGLVNRFPGERSLTLVAEKREREFLYGKARFLEEARNLARFTGHRNIVSVCDYFEENNTAYLAMELLDGQTLSQTLQQRKEPLPYDACVRIAAELCQALRAIHRENILHRDISPDNIMLCRDGTVKLFDFGAARFPGSADNGLAVVVKPGYAPPEQYDRVSRQDARTDVYALGATLYYAMTKVKPEESTDRVDEDGLVEPAKLVPGIPDHVSAAVMRAMAVRPRYRFADTDQMEKALLGRKKVVSEKKLRDRLRLRRALGIAACFLAIAVGAGAFVLLWTAP